MASPGHLKNNNLWVRCWVCGDSNNINHAHMAISIEGLYRCVRCGASGKLTTAQFLEYFKDSDVSRLTTEEYNPTHFYTVYNRLLPGPGSSRFSLLERFHLSTTRGNQDVFVITNAIGDPIGVQVCTPRNKLIVGEKGVAWSKGEEVIVSTKKRPLFLVEGPYDVGYENEVCCFGLPDSHVMRMLRGHYIVIEPDPDVFLDEKKLEVIRRAVNNPWNEVLGIMIMTSGRDPDVTPLEQRLFVPKSQLKWAQTRRSTQDMVNDYLAK